MSEFARSSQRRHELVDRLQSLPNLTQGGQALLVNELYDIELPILEEALLQISHVCMTHNEAEVQILLRKFMLWIAGKSFSMALRLAWAVESVLDVFETFGLGDRAREVQDKIESFAINRVPISKKLSRNEVTEDVVAKKELRLKMFSDEKNFISIMANMSSTLRTYPDKQRRQIELKTRLHEINDSLNNQFLIYPLGSGTDPVKWIVRIAVDDCAVLSSRERAPFLLRCEVITDDTATMNDPTATKLRLPNGQFRIATHMEELLDMSRINGEREENDTNKKDVEVKKGNNLFCTAFGEMAVERAARIRRQSPFGSHPKWDIVSIIVKAGDDLRQEELALQLIDIFNKIWREAGITCMVKSYGAISVGPDSGVIECLDNASSLDSIKKSCQVTYLSQFFNEAYGPKGSEAHRRAQKNFVETMAGYSIVCYMLQIKDRHNGNIMITSEGHLVHIDFGFMFVTSPGGINFESAPFKLSHDLLDVMGGVGSTEFNNFKVLVYQGMVAARERAEEILGLVSLMTPYNTIACFGSDPAGAVQQIRSRFRFDLETEADFALYVKDLIMTSVDNWRTRRYDQFQTLQNGIL